MSIACEALNRKLQYSKQRGLALETHKIELTDYEILYIHHALSIWEQERTSFLSQEAFEAKEKIVRHIKKKFPDMASVSERINEFKEKQQ